MTATDMISQRLINQQIAEPVFKQPQQVVSWLVAMQAQEYAMAKWAIGLRTNDLTDAGVELAFNEGQILRTHLMRPTWHFVAPEDIRWLLALTAPRIKAAMAYYDRKLELDDKLFKRSNNILAKALQGGKHLTRTALQAHLQKAKIVADGQRLGHLMMRAEQDGIVCSGPRQGKQFTYALLEERVPPIKAMSRADALVAFVNRYFAGRGPATLHDFAYWSGLTMQDARAGAEGLLPHFIKEKMNGQQYIFPPTASKPLNKLQSSFLMPDYDEYGMSYKDRDLILAGRKVDTTHPRENLVFNRVLIADGLIVGTWKRTIENNKAFVETFPFAPLSKIKQQAIKKAVKRFIEFVGKPGKNDI
jgi:hypothetical protein